MRNSISMTLVRLTSLALACMVLPACGGKDSGPASPTTTPTQANRPPTVTITASPAGQAIMGATNVALTATGSDPDGDAVSYSWNFGDGTTGSGATVSKVFNSAGTFNVTVNASDGKGGNATASQAVTVRTLTGFWRGGQRGLTEALDIDHLSGNRLTGKVTTGVASCGGQIGGTVTSPRTVEISISFSGNCSLGTERYDAVVDTALQSMTGTYQIGNNRVTWTFTRD